MTPYGPVLSNDKARRWFREELRKIDEEEGDGGSDSSSEELLTPRASPKNNTAAAGINRPTALVTFPSSEASVSRVVGISAAVQSAIESKLGRKDGDDRDKLLLNMNNLIGNKTAIVEAAAKCSASLRKRTFEAIPTKKFALRSNKPLVAAAMSKAWSTFYEVLRNKNHGLTTRVLKDLAVFIEILERAHKYCLGESERAKVSSNKGVKTVKLTKAALDRVEERHTVSHVPGATMHSLTKSLILTKIGRRIIRSRRSSSRIRRIWKNTRTAIVTTLPWMRRARRL